MKTISNRDSQTEDELLRSLLRDAGAATGTVATSNLVNRTHRVVQERARTVAARRSKIRSLWVPLLIFSSLLVGICVALWTVLDEYELVASGTQVASYQVLVPLFWSIPVSAALLAVVWFRQARDTGRRPVE
jgi:hypothetical protein